MDPSADSEAPSSSSKPMPFEIIPPTPSVSHLFKVYKPPASSAASSAVPELTDADFEPSAAELQAAYSGQKSRLDAMVNAPLKTQAIKDREHKAKMNRWPQTTIRIKFPNQLILERSFESTEKIKAVYQFVRGALIEEALGDKFVLYQPPKRELKVSDPEIKVQSLAELGLAPSSVLLVRFQSEAYNNTNLPPPLLPQILEQAVALPGTAEAEAEQGNGTSTSATPKPKPSASSGGEKKVPKWFKMGANLKK
ncbi:hypothetical protein DL93DRAFT_2162695 [Clavulina sp. PMI_390]|nr:hypothetical protein DL93DRAFT_2162695 [Clavulina sp. PMI_390]